MVTRETKARLTGVAGLVPFGAFIREIGVDAELTRLFGRLKTGLGVVYPMGAQLRLMMDVFAVGEHRPFAVESLSADPLFLSAALPLRVFPPLFNRYRGGQSFGNHVDNAIRQAAGGARLRTDVSATLFLSEPSEYDGGELLVEDTYGVHSVKLPAGHLVLYPATSLHRVAPIKRGVRVASFFWIQSMIRDDGQRTLLFDLDMAIIRMTEAAPGNPALVSLTGVYHNLLRMWAEP